MNLPVFLRAIAELVDTLNLRLARVPKAFGTPSAR